MPEERPSHYYHPGRTTLLSQGDIFRDVPTIFLDESKDTDEEDTEEVVLDNVFAGVGYAMLITPTAFMRGQGATTQHSSSERVFVPVRPLSEVLRGREPTNLVDLKKWDAWPNFMYLPAFEAPPTAPGKPRVSFPESVAYLYIASSIDQSVLDAPDGPQRVTQLSYDATCQLLRKLMMFNSRTQEIPRSKFNPPRD
jgi:hypothetical protein